MAAPANVMRRVQQTAGGQARSPTAQKGSELQAAANCLVATRQRAVLPEGSSCGMWSFSVPWAPFQHYLETLAADAKPFLWSQPFRLGGGEFMAFFGIERMEAENGRLCLWLGICNNLSQPVNVYSKTELWMPGTLDTSPCGETWLVGDAVDTLAPCGQQGAQSFGRFWWHVAPTDVQQHLFRAAGDGEDERSFDVFLSLRLNPQDGRTRSPARDEDPRLWDLSKRYISPWVQGIATARVTAATTPLQARIQALVAEADGIRRQALEDLRAAAENEEKKLRDMEGHYTERLQNAEQRMQQLEEDASRAEAMRQRAETLRQQQQQEAQRREAALEHKLRDSEQREDGLRKQLAQQQQHLEQAAQREGQLRQRGQQLEQRLAEAGAREEALRKRGSSLEGMLADAAKREEMLRENLSKLHDYIQGTQTREEKFRADITALEGRAREGASQQDALRRRIGVLEAEKQQAAANEAMLRDSNTRLLAAAVEEQGRAQAISSSPQRQRHQRSAMR
eukprot:TRINITY_DN21214_c0_g1_i1.p1 TRINITY_DN21214_c0_g1~~TRINITY_DN21214_c0_g1_i1.p1  ORF type:complete len:528 (+),score=206.62 TRINITY_DN21214_c0_g1_i1:60-1586(+)